MPAQDLHSCSWFCEQPLCVLAQRNELRQRVEELEANGPQMQRGHSGDGTIWMGSMRECLADARSCADAEASIADALVTENKVLRARIAEMEGK